MASQNIWEYVEIAMNSLLNSSWIFMDSKSLVGNGISSKCGRLANLLRPPAWLDTTTKPLPRPGIPPHVTVKDVSSSGSAVKAKQGMLNHGISMFDVWLTLINHVQSCLTIPLMNSIPETSSSKLHWDCSSKLCQGLVEFWVSDLRHVSAAGNCVSPHLVCVFALETFIV